MWRLTWKGLLAHRLRLALTATAIVLGVTFVAGTFILTDTLHSTFTSLFGSVYQKVDFEVRGVAQLSGRGADAVRNPIPESLLGTVRRIPGVAAADGAVQGFGQFVTPKGSAVSTGGAPTLAVAFDPDPRLSQLHVVEGRPPTSPTDVVMDAATAAKYHFHVGQQVRVILPSGVETFDLSGVVRFGTAENLAGATLAAFALPTAQRVLGEVGQLDAIAVAVAPGADRAVVQQDIASALPKGVEVVTGQTVADEQTSSINQALSFFQTALLVFAFIALFVGAFTILNTFSIIVGQRTRELALLRVVGASRRQVFRSVLGEAAVVGLVSSLVGIGLGVLAAIGLEALLRGFGIDLPSGPPVFEARTAIVGLAVGVGVTMVAAVGPARRAIRIPPVAAITDQAGTGDLSLRGRFVRGGVLVVVGGVALGAGLAKPAVQLVGLGAACLFLGVALLAPAVARPSASTIGRPLARVLGVAGRLGRENSMRSPRRTAQTAAALMVGLALVSAMSVFGASLSRSATSSIDDAVRADLIVSPTSPTGLEGLSAAVPKLADSVPGVVASSSVYRDRFELRHSVVSLGAVSTHDLESTVILHTTAGSTRALSEGELLVDTTTARTEHLTVGERVPVTFALTGPTQLRIGGIFQPNAATGSYLVSEALFAAHFQNPLPAAVLLATNGSPGTEQAVRAALKPYPNLQVQTRTQFEQAQTGQVNKLLGLVYALLGLAVLIALIGIVNTLMLSVFERTHELGLLRAVGMRRRQVRTMIRAESVILAVFGAGLGIVIGTGLGVALVRSLASQGLNQMEVPFTSLVVFLVLSAVLGLLAATWPARRAARLDVLAAIAAD